jgi:pseudouridine synthase
MTESGWKTEAGDPPPDRYDDDARGPRLQKVLAEAGVGSRRACEELIESGAVEVNGRTIDHLPAWVDPVRDHIAVNGRQIGRPEPLVYVMLFKPRGIVATNFDPEHRRRAIDLVDHPKNPRLYPVGRLDAESSGLLLLTNDGELANRLTHPRYGVHKVYEVTVEGSLDEQAVKKLERGVFLHERRRRRAGRTARSELRLIKRGRERTKLRMELREGRNRQIRRMMLYVGHKVRKLRRVKMGPLKLSGLRAGQWRELTADEVKALRRVAFAKKPTQPRNRKPRRPNDKKRTQKR